MCLRQLSLYFGFVLQVLLQVLIVLSGNYNFFNLLTLTLCLSLLDDQHVHFWLRKRSMGSDGGMNANTNLAFACVTSHVYPFSLQARPLGRGSVTCWSWWSGLSWLQELFCASTCSWIRLKWPSPPGRVRACATIKIKTCIKLTLRFKLMVPVCLYGVLSSIHLPPVQPVYEDRHHSLCLDRGPLSHLGVGLLHVQVGLFSVCWWSAGGKGVTRVLCSRRCACISGFLKRFCGTVQWTVFAAATAAMFTVSLVGHSRAAIDESFRGYKLVLFPTRCPSPMWIMTLTPDYGRRCVRLTKWWIATSWSTHTACSKGWLAWAGGPRSSSRGATMASHGRWAWLLRSGFSSRVPWVTGLLDLLQEIEFMYKPGNLSAPPPVLTPHQPRLDWQMWFAALGSHTQAPWFTSLMYRLLQGKQDGRPIQSQTL